MKIVRFDDRRFVPAGHENPLSPGVLKKVLLERADLQEGRIQMVNWASLGAGKQFARHYHEDMQEIFVIIDGEAEAEVSDNCFTLHRGDTLVIDPREIHQMRNTGAQAVEYLAIGIVGTAGGKTVVVDDGV